MVLHGTKFGNHISKATVSNGTYKLYGYILFYVTNISLQNPIILFDFLFCLEILCTAFIRFDSNSYFLEVIYLRQKSTKTWGYIITMLYCPMLFFAFHTCKRFTVLCICLYTRFYKQSPMRHLSLIF